MRQRAAPRGEEGRAGCPLCQGGSARRRTACRAVAAGGRARRLRSPKQERRVGLREDHARRLVVIHAVDCRCEYTARVSSSRGGSSGRAHAARRQGMRSSRAPHRLGCLARAAVRRRRLPVAACARVHAPLPPPFCSLPHELTARHSSATRTHRSQPGGRSGWRGQSRAGAVRPR